MKAWELLAFGAQNLHLVERPIPKLKQDEILVRVASVVTSKPAMRGRLKTGHGEWPKTGSVLPCRSGFGKADCGDVLS